MARLAFTVLVVTAAIAPQTRYGQVGCTFMSLEWLVADAEVVVCASVAEVSREKPEEQWVWMTVTLKVHETLKGRAGGWHVPESSKGVLVG